ncbi:glycosyltransferase [Sphingobacterium alkalisoli]|uniref:Glycosyltransferase n=1 Tax=Sphingobacterium alkalisoli TaxID=1874115 RepID=A0A4V5LXW5_9SPHI|nr:glycosyltransferase family 2 protein [Sphingobacterium alkalisoli]TJY64219.1 glycosyltransferase [Sphingobacterium alkalisoli]GGH23116.1 glycosyl transferase family 2 [Sphingobacterium alkalisoli]
MDQKKTTLLISTYNWHKALRLCFDSVLVQTVLPDEILIADDGSKEDTRNTIDEFRLRTSIPIKHIWQEDEGFQLSKIRNKAIAQSECDYIIQIDGDIIMDKHFIQDHLGLKKSNCFIIGSRALLSEAYSLEILGAEEVLHESDLKKNTKNTLNAIRIPSLTRILSPYYKTSGKHKYYAKGCNMSFWRDAFLAVNGYNEDISGWGSEDEELIARLFKLGQEKLFLKFGAIAYHIWHPIATRNNKEKNNLIFQKTIRATEFRISNGINKYLK